jgi:hypothetical protein
VAAILGIFFFSFLGFFLLPTLFKTTEGVVTGCQIFAWAPKKKKKNWVKKNLTPPPSFYYYFFLIPVAQNFKTCCWSEYKLVGMVNFLYRIPNFRNFFGLP